MSTFAPLFVPDELREAVSGRAWLEAMLDAERALARAGALAGVVPAPAAAAIAEACAGDGYDWEQLLREGRRTGNPAEPLVRALVARVGEETARWVHLGATSQDVMDTAAMLVTRRALDLVLAELDRVTSACAALARSHRDTPMAGRTLLQQAVPTTFGLKAAGWLVAVLDARARLAQLRNGALAAQLGGAVGTLAALGEHGLEIARLYARELDLAEPTLPWHTNRVRIAELGARPRDRRGRPREDRSRRSPARADGGRRGTRGRGGRRLLGDAPEAQRGRCDEDPRLRRAHAGARVRAHGRARPGARAGRRGLAGRVGGALGRARVRPAARLPRSQGRWKGSRSTRLGCGRTSTSPAGRSSPSGSRSSSPSDSAAQPRARSCGTPRSAPARPGGRSPRSSPSLDTGLTAEEIEAALEPTTYLGSAGVLVDRALARYDAEREDASEAPPGRRGPGRCSGTRAL